MLTDMMLAERDPGIICTEAQNIQTSDSQTISVSEKTGGSNGQTRCRCSNCFEDTGDMRKSHYSDSSFDRFVLLPDFNCCQLLS